MFTGTPPARESSARHIETLSPELRVWVRRVRNLGWAEFGAAMLHALEPMSILGAQVLYMAQPLARLSHSGVLSANMGELAALLETPDGLAALRAALTDDTFPTEKAG